MKKLLLTALILFAFATVKSQTIQSSNYGTTGYITSDGTIQNSNYSTVGYIKSNGTIQNSNYSTIGILIATERSKIATIRLLGM